MRRISTLTIICVFAFTSFIFAQPGTLDSSFGVNGKVITMNGTNAAIALQTDGKTVVVGTIGDAYYGSTYFVMSRYNTNGSVDSSFGIHGEVDTYFDTGVFTGATATSLLIQPDGKIVAGGYIYHPSVGPDYYALARYMPNGDPDSTFGTNGKASDFIGPFPKENEMEALSLQRNGKIVAGGWSDGYCVVRYKSDGHIDSSFATDGILRNQDSISGPVNDLFFQKNGEIITACQGWGSYQNYVDNFEINRLTSDGLYDSSFGNNGFVLTDFFGASEQPFSLIQLNDSSFIAGGYANDSASSTYTAFAKYKKNGRLFNSFGTNGKTTIPSTSGGNMRVLLQKDDKIISAGSILVRLNPDGSIDSTFGNNGKAINFAGALDAVLQSDEKIVTMNSGILQRFKADYPVIGIQKNIVVTEGNSGYTAAKFKVLLNHASASTVKVSYTTKDGTAQAGSDYVATSGMVTIKPGKVSKTVTVNIIGDNVYENKEKFSLVLSNPVNAVLSDLDSTACTIKNDDPLSPQAQTNSDAIANSATIKLFPNPVVDEFKIEGLNSTNATISVIDMQGKKLFKTFANSNSYTMNVKQLSAGVYYLRIETEEKITILKFIKE